MSEVTCDISVSVDGFAAGPNQTLEEPFGDGDVERVHEWMFEGREDNVSEVEAIVAAEEALDLLRLVRRLDEEEGFHGERGNGEWAPGCARRLGYRV